MLAWLVRLRYNSANANQTSLVVDMVRPVQMILKAKRWWW